MRTDASIKKLFVKKLKNDPIDSISVNSLCKELKIERQTFYYHYRDIYEVLEAYLLDIKEEYLLLDEEILLDRVFKNFSENIDIYAKIANSNLRQALFDFVRDLLLKAILYKITCLDISKELTNSSIMEISKYVSLYATEFILDKIKDEFDFDEKRVRAKLEVIISDEVLSAYVNGYINNRASI